MIRAEPAHGENPRLKVVVLIPGPKTVAWIARALMKIADASCLYLEVRSLQHDRSVSTGSARLRLYTSLDRRIFRPRLDAFEEVELPFEINPSVEPDVSAGPPDVVLDLTGGVHRPDDRIRPTNGVWVPRVGTGLGLSISSCFWDVFSDHPVTPLQLLRFGDLAVPPALISESFSASSELSLMRAANVAFWKIPNQIVRALSLLAEGHGETLQPEAVEARRFPLEPRHDPGTRHLLRLGLRTAFRVIRNRFRNARYDRRWFIAVRRTDDQDPQVPFRIVPSGPERFYADPFPADWEDNSFVFFEDYSYREGKGVISFVRVGADGRQSETQVALETEYHLSYPFVFRWNGDWYLIPESSQCERIDLFRAASFPAGWRLQSTLLDGYPAVDATLVEVDDLWWMFVNPVSEAGANEELDLFVASTPLGPWSPHRGNPVVADVRRARGAGAILRIGDGLYRPAQDCSTHYGAAVVLNRIDRLDRLGYAETPVGKLSPDWLPHLRGTHTVNRSALLEVVDGMVESRSDGRWHSVSRTFELAIPWLREGEVSSGISPS